MRHAHICVSDVRLVRGTPNDAERGLLGYVGLTVNGSFRIDGLTLRRMRSGRIGVAFPRHRGGFRPLDDDARRAIEAQVLAALYLPPEVAS